MDELDEKVLDITQRQKRAQIMRRYKAKIERSREIAQNKLAPEKNIKKRAYAQARQIVRKRFAGKRGAEYEKLGPSEKMSIDRAIEKKAGLIKKIALRLIPKVKSAEAKRLQSFHLGKQLQNHGAEEGHKPVNEQLNALFTEKFDGTSSSQMPDENKPDAKAKGDKQEKVKKKAKTGDIILYNKFGEEVALSRPVFEGLTKKSEKSGIDIETLAEVYNRGRDAWQDNGKVTKEQYAFARVNSYINEGSAYYELDADLHGEELHEKRGLWDNIHAKRKRIKAGSGERMRKPGSKGAPTAQNFKDAQESVQIDEANKYSVHKGKEGWYVNQHTNNGVWNHSVQTGYHDSKNKAVAWAKKHAGNREHTIDIKEDVELEEGMIHSVHVRTYDSKGAKTLNSKEFKDHVKAHGGEVHYASDKGVAFKFKHAYQANDFHRRNMSHFRDLGSENDGEMHEEVQIDEISQKTLKSYASKAEKSYDKASRQDARAQKAGDRAVKKYGEFSHQADTAYAKAEKPQRTMEKRFAGMKMASKKIKEETQIDEMDKSQGSRRSFDNFRGQDKTAKAIPVKNASNDALKTLNKSFKKEEVEIEENAWNQLGQKKPVGNTLPAPARGTVPKHNRKFSEGDHVVPHTGPHAGEVHRVTSSRSGSVNIVHPNGKYDTITVRAKHEHLSPATPEQTAKYKADRRKDAERMGLALKEEVEIEEGTMKPYVKPHNNERGEQVGWKSANKYGKTKYWQMFAKKSAEKHAGLSEDCGCDNPDSGADNAEIAPGTKKRRKEGTVVSRPDTKPSKMGKQKELKDKVLDEEGNTENDPAKREVGTDSVVKAFKKDTPGQDPVLNESFNIAYSAGVGVTLTAADLGMKVKSGFELHPSVVEELKKLDAEEESE